MILFMYLFSCGIPVGDFRPPAHLVAQGNTNRNNASMAIPLAKESYAFAQMKYRYGYLYETAMKKRPWAAFSLSPECSKPSPANASKR